MNLKAQTRNELAKVLCELCDDNSCTNKYSFSWNCCCKETHDISEKQTGRIFTLRSPEGYRLAIVNDKEVANYVKEVKE